MNIDQACCGNHPAWEELQQMRRRHTRLLQSRNFYRRRCGHLDEKIEELQQKLYELTLQEG